MSTSKAIIIAAVILGLAVIYNGAIQRFEAIALGELLVVVNKETGEPKACIPELVREEGQRPKVIYHC